MSLTFSFWTKCNLYGWTKLIIVKSLIVVYVLFVLKISSKTYAQLYLQNEEYILQLHTMNFTLRPQVS